MIKLENIEDSYLTCHSCGETKDLIQISIGRNERQTIVIRLCKKCYSNLNKA
jgi:formate dehydrogenase maturation protein FdhE